MKRFLEGREDVIVKYIRHVMANGSFYPITSFFLVSCGVIWGLWEHRLNLLHAAVVLGFAGLILLLIADRRDQRRANASFEVQLEAVRALVQSSAAMASAVATVRSDHQEASMHAQDVSIANIADYQKDA